jgi:glycosyltransferase involved in cell wall biosynthesis
MAMDDPERPTADPPDARLLRPALARMRDALAQVQSELDAERRQLQDARRREAELETAVAVQQPFSPPSLGGRLRRRLRLVRRSIGRFIVRLTPRHLLAFIWHNPLFDAGWYLERNPDVRTHTTTPERHYRRHGTSEGRDPAPLFETDWYLARYPDVAASGMDPLDHYHLFGAWEGRDPSPWFHSSWYLATNPDVAYAAIDPLLHYARHGASEGRPLRPGGSRSPGSVNRLPHPAGPRDDRSLRRRPWRWNEAARGANLLDAVPRGRPIVLMMDDIVPRPDRDAGSVLVEQYIRLFQGFGYHVLFFALRDDEISAKDRGALEASGVTVVDVRAGQADLDALLATDGQRVDVAFLSRVTVAGHHVDDVARLCPRARIIFNTQDLHFLREERAARLIEDRVGLYRAASTRELEIHAVRMADATIVVSQVEKGILEAAVPGAAVYWCPLIQEVVGRTNGFGVRSGIAFVGGYRHLPNVDALYFFLDEVWPLIHEAAPAMRFYAIGADMPDGLRGRRDPGFVPVGQVPELAPWFERVRLTVAPLRFGAGMKGKVLSSLAHGVPCVATSVAAEGMDGPGRGILVADGARDLAKAILRLHEDAASWEALADAGLSWVDSNVSVRLGRERLRGMLADLGSPVGGLSDAGT